MLLVELSSPFPLPPSPPPPPTTTTTSTSTFTLSSPSPSSPPPPLTTTLRCCRALAERNRVRPARYYLRGGGKAVLSSTSSNHSFLQRKAHYCPKRCCKWRKSLPLPFVVEAVELPTKKVLIPQEKNRLASLPPAISTKILTTAVLSHKKRSVSASLEPSSFEHTRQLLQNLETGAILVSLCFLPPVIHRLQRR
ncbi:uncharacterized protein LY89DRAFT_303851 [Mollisia scopiformis]|uniref:Uncharacterized protein n=1 Tax=Mollisia scopiformis TaxID=149040 RepID=A0A194XR84_MOLSC|nr:uncharacterized protein LY89DRAFT_303851 [Mollisia scopiformis]KUJ22564.1 hypothetical protein LY89DRAFT_303851 [Mollisia scopiformis]